MNVAYQIKPTNEKRQEFNELLSGYWSNDVWDIRDSFFDDLFPAKWSSPNKTIDFSSFNHSIKDEVKYMFAYRLQEKQIRLISVLGYAQGLKRYAEFLDDHYPKIVSIVDIPYDKAILQWRSFLIDKGFKVNDNGELSSKNYEVFFNQLYSFFVDFYDARDEYEKDIWDCRKIPGAKLTENMSEYFLNFTDIPLKFRDLLNLEQRIILKNNARAI